MHKAQKDSWPIRRKELVERPLLGILTLRDMNRNFGPFPFMFSINDKNVIVHSLPQKNLQPIEQPYSDRGAGGFWVPLLGLLHAASAFHLFHRGNLCRGTFQH